MQGAFSFFIQIVDSTSGVCPTLGLVSGATASQPLFLRSSLLLVTKNTQIWYLNIDFHFVSPPVNFFFFSRRFLMTLEVHLRSRPACIGMFCPTTLDYIETGKNQPSSPRSSFLANNTENVEQMHLEMWLQVDCDFLMRLLQIQSVVGF